MSDEAVNAAETAVGSRDPGSTQHLVSELADEALRTARLEVARVRYALGTQVRALMWWLFTVVFAGALGIFAAVEFVAGISGAMTQLLGGPAWVGRLGAGVALIVLIKASVVWARYSRDRRWMRRLRDRFRKSPVNEAAS